MCKYLHKHIFMLSNTLEKKKWKMQAKCIGEWLLTIEDGEIN